MRSHSFRFIDDKLNRKLIRLLEKSAVRYSVDADGLIRYSEGDAELVENQLIKSVRDSAFSDSWQILSCSKHWIARYSEYMRAHQIPFIEEQSDGEYCFLLPRNYRPHGWKLPADRVTEKQRVATG